MYDGVGVDVGVGMCFFLWSLASPGVAGVVEPFHPRTEGKENFYPITAPAPAMCMVCYDLIDSVMHIAKRKTRINRKILYYTPLCGFFFS